MAADRSSVAYVNRALTLLGENEVNSLDAGESPEAATAAILYEATREEMLGGFDWGFARRTVDLAQLTASPAEPWTYQYALPDDFLLLREITPGGTNYQLVADEEPPHQQRLVSHQTSVRLTYTANLSEGLFPPYFQAALVAKLAAVMAGPIAEDDNKELKYERLSMKLERTARVTDYNQTPARAIADDASLASRRFVPTTSSSRTFS